MRAVAPVVAALVAPVSGAAQEYSVLLGAVHTRYADSVQGSAGRVAARLDLRGGLWTMRLEAGAAHFATGGDAVNGTVSGMGLRPVGGRIGIGLAGAGSGIGLSNGWSGSVAGGPTAVVVAGPTVWQLTGTVGAIRDLAGTQWTLGGVSALARVGVGPVEVVAGALGTRTDTLGWLDVTSRLILRSGGVEVSADGGIRTGDLADDPWGSVRLTWQVIPSVALEAGGGRSPRDLTGFGAGTHLDVGVRLRRRATPTPTHPSAYLRGSVQVARLGDGRVRLRIPYQGDADVLAISGPFSDWQPIPLVRRGPGEWEVILMLPPGVSEYTLVTGERFVLPDGVVGVDDGFGGRVGLLWIP